MRDGSNSNVVTASGSSGQRDTITVGTDLPLLIQWNDTDNLHSDFNLDSNPVVTAANQAASWNDRIAIGTYPVESFGANFDNTGNGGSVLQGFGGSPARRRLKRLVRGQRA